jgi:hypothetical protein
MNIITIITLIILIILTLVFVLKKKIIALSLYLPKILFPVFLILALTGLFWGSLYDKLADLTLKHSGTHQMLVDWDLKINALNPKNKIEEVTEEVKEKTTGFFTNLKNAILPGDNDQAEPSEQEQPINSSEIEAQIKEFKFLETELYPKLISLISFIYRLFIVLLSIIGMALIIYFGFSVESFVQIKDLEKEVKKLKGKMVKLEEQDQLKIN